MTFSSFFPLLLPQLHNKFLQLQFSRAGVAGPCSSPGTAAASAHVYIHYKQWFLPAAETKKQGFIQSKAPLKKKISMVRNGSHFPILGCGKLQVSLVIYAGSVFSQQFSRVLKRSYSVFWLSSTVIYNLQMSAHTRKLVHISNPKHQNCRQPQSHAAETFLTGPVRNCQR